MYAANQSIEIIMWKYLTIGLILGLTSCNVTNKNSENSGAEKENDIQAVMGSIEGQWDIVNAVENDSSYVRPSEIEQGVTAYIDFREDNTFGIMTNCNHLGGEYHQYNDSIRLTNILSTEIACDNMELEELLKKILPNVNTIDCINDSITRLNSNKGDSYIVLKHRNRSLK